LLLPDQSFDEIAVELLGAAGSAAEAVSAAEILEARGLAGGGLRHTMEELRQRAETMGGLYRFFREAAPFEEQIRDLLAALNAVTEAETERERKSA
jgi:hypothetical protein